MGKFVYVTAVIFLIIWAVAYYVFDARNIVHLLLISAAVMILIKVIFGTQRL